MPAFVLGNAIAAVLMRHTRSAMLQVLSSDYVRTARAVGVRAFVVTYKYALKNACIPTITILGLGIGRLLGGANNVQDSRFGQLDPAQGNQPRVVVLVMKVLF